MTHLNELSKVYLDQISEALTPEQRAAAQEILNKETGADKKKAEMKAKKKRSEVRKEKELELKQANLEIRKRREDRRDKGAKDREKNKAEQEKRDALKAKQRDLASKVKEKSKASAGASKAAQASLASVKPKETITDKDGDGTALGKLGANVARAGAGVAGATLNTVKSIRLRQQAKKTQGKLDKTKVQEDTLLEVDEVDSKDKKADKVIDVMRGKNKVEVNPKLKAEGVEMEGVVDMVKKGAKRHAKAIEKKKIKNRKAVPYAALGASYEPEGELVDEAAPLAGVAKGVAGAGKVIAKTVVAGTKAVGKAAGEGIKAGAKTAGQTVAIAGGEAAASVIRGAGEGAAERVKRKVAGRNEEFEGEELKEYSPNVTYQAKGGKKSGKLGKSSVYSLRDKDESKKDFRKSHVKDVEDGYVGKGHKPTPGSLRKEDYHSGQGEKIAARTRKWMKKKGQDGAPGLDAMKARTAEHKAKRGVKEDVTITDAKGRDFLEIIDIIKPEPMKSPKNTVQWTEEKIAKLMKKANEKKRKNALQINKIVGTQ